MDGTGYRYRSNVMKSIASIAPVILSFAFIGAALYLPVILQTVSAQPLGATSLASSDTVEPRIRQADPAVDTLPHGAPRYIRIPEVGVDITIKDGSYDETLQVWTIDEDSAFYAVNTPLLNTKSGSSFIYGHNSDYVFKKLLGISGKASASVITDTGYEFTYAFTERKTVSPTDVGVLAHTDSPRIILQTCTGIWNEKREIFYFEYQGVKQLTS